jgi:uncharacterized membrane protein YdcZ (DUF606 family)
MAVQRLNPPRFLGSARFLFGGLFASMFLDLAITKFPALGATFVFALVLFGGAAVR